MYEKHRQTLAPRRVYAARVAKHGGIGLLILAACLGMGILGYHYLDGQSWLDSLLNASMILGGMGPVGDLHTTSGKLFASFYALFSGVVFLVMMAIVLAPVVHRWLHKFHLDEQSK